MQRAGPGTRHYLCKELQEVKELEIHVSLGCDICGGPLAITSTAYIAGIVYATITPCQTCLEKARCEAEEEGREAEILATSNRIRGGR